LVQLRPTRQVGSRNSSEIRDSTNISDLRRLEQTLRKSEHEMRLVTDNAPALIAYVDRDEVFRQ
jgi:PAS domain-containing protein